MKLTNVDVKNYILVSFLGTTLSSFSTSDPKLLALSGKSNSLLRELKMKQGAKKYYAIQELATRVFNVMKDYRVLTLEDNEYMVAVELLLTLLEVTKFTKSFKRAYKTKTVVKNCNKSGMIVWFLELQKTVNTMSGSNHCVTREQIGNIVQKPIKAPKVKAVRDISTKTKEATETNELGRQRSIRVRKFLKERIHKIKKA